MLQIPDSFKFSKLQHYTDVCPPPLSLAVQPCSGSAREQESLHASWSPEVPKDSQVHRRALTGCLPHFPWPWRGGCRRENQSTVGYWRTAGGCRCFRKLFKVVPHVLGLFLKPIFSNEKVLHSYCLHPYCLVCFKDACNTSNNMSSHDLRQTTKYQLDRLQWEVLHSSTWWHATLFL